MEPASKNTDVTIVGGGFAGLAAALRLHRAGASIRVLEKRPFFGGRAYSFADPKTGQIVDNGQHLLMGAYHETFRFLRELGTLKDVLFQKGLRVSFAEDAQSIATLQCPNLPAPFHLALGLLRFKGLKFKDKRKMNRLVKFCKRAGRNGDNLDQLSVTELFKKTGQTEDAVKKFWEPLGLATLNEPMELASAELFMEVIIQGLLAKKSDSNLVIPKIGFSDLYANPARRIFEDGNVPLHFQTQVARVEKSGTGWEIHNKDGEKFKSKHILFTVPPNALKLILQSSNGTLSQLVPDLDRFKSSPIISINLWYDDFIPEESFLGLIGSPIHWVFNKAKILENNESKYLSLVISGAYALSDKNKESLVNLATQEIIRFYPKLKNQTLLHSQVIKENEATFSGRMGLKPYRPRQRTSVPGIFIAGDWTATDLPATIESAVASGHKAADSILTNK